MLPRCGPKLSWPTYAYHRRVWNDLFEFTSRRLSKALSFMFGICFKVNHSSPPDQSFHELRTAPSQEPQCYIQHYNFDQAARARDSRHRGLERPRADVSYPSSHIAVSTTSRVATLLSGVGKASPPAVSDVVRFKASSQTSGKLESASLDHEPAMASFRAFLFSCNNPDLLRECTRNGPRQVIATSPWTVEFAWPSSLSIKLTSATGLHLLEVAISTWPVPCMCM